MNIRDAHYIGNKEIQDEERENDICLQLAAWIIPEWRLEGWRGNNRKSVRSVTFDGELYQRLFIQFDVLVKLGY